MYQVIFKETGEKMFESKEKYQADIYRNTCNYPYLYKIIYINI